MIKAINLSEKNPSFDAKPKDENRAEDETRILPNTPKTRIKQKFQKTSSAFLDYPAKGLKGDINSDFYEFLTMGAVPYLIGSAAFMTVFNIINPYLKPKSRQIAAVKGNKLALGVAFYGIFKSLSKNLVTFPVKMATGVDVEMPYENIVYPLPKEAGEDASIDIQHQQRKVYDSVEFYRKDLLDKEYFDDTAKRLGLGDNLNDSITEVSPIIQNVVVTTNLAKSLSSYAWAAVGVGLAVQDSWSEFFNAFSKRTSYTPKEGESFLSKLGGHARNTGKNIQNISKAFCKSFTGGCKSLWKGKPSSEGYMKHAGKGLVVAAAGLTVLLSANSIIRAKNMTKNRNVNSIDKTKESTVI